jgi:hypothetical protein
MISVFGQIVLTKSEYAALIAGQPHHRICKDCGKQILNRHKFYFGEDGRVRHKCCKSPESITEQLPTVIQEKFEL